LDLYEGLKAQGNKELYSHWKCAPEDRKKTQRLAHCADVYIMSANAISESDGAILNIDGTGNRVGAICSGPDIFYILVGQNKFAPDREAAMERVKTVACPKNARRLNLNTPCAKVDRCLDCKSEGRMCNLVLWTEGAPKNREFHICVAGEDLGY
jgi:hypothetical protein